MKLFNRQGRTIALTDAGVALAPLAREMVQRSLQIEETMRSLHDEVHGHLQVACSTTPGKYILPQLLAEFHSHFPRVRVTCNVSAQHLALEALSQGEAHFALASTPPLVHKQVEFQHFYTDEVVLIAPRRHRWAGRAAIEPAELMDETFILREDSSGTQQVVARALQGVGCDMARLDPLLTLGNSEAIALAVQEGMGVGFVSRIVVTRLDLDQVAIVAVAGADFHREIFLGRHTGRHTGRPQTIAQRTFWDFALQGKDLDAVRQQFAASSDPVFPHP